MKKILVLGGNGAIGKYIVDYFYERKEEYGISLLTADIEDSEFIKERSDYYRLDVSKKENFEQLPKDIYAIIDLATIMPARMVGYDPKLYIDTNIGGTYNVLDFCVKNKIDRLLFAQTFGDILQHAEEKTILTIDMIPEQDYADNKSVYITTMNTAVELIKCYHAVYHLKTFIFRLPTIHYWTSKVYCENGVQTKEGYRIMIDQATNGEDIHVWGDPTRIKDMVYAKDLCQMFFKACVVDRDYGFYNVGNGFGISLLDQIKGIVEVFDDKKTSKILFSPEMRNAPQYVMCVDEAKEDLGYEPKYSYIEMLQDMKKERELGRF